MAMDQADLQAITAAISAGFSQQSSGYQGSASSSGSSGSKAFGDLTKATGDVAKGLAAGGGSVKDFTETLTGSLGPLGKAFSGIVGYIDNTNNTFQGLSKVGAGFNANLGELRMSAADTRMGFDEFGSLIGNNATQLASFAGGVKGGATQFTKLSRAMFQDGQMIEGFMNLGYTVGEANEFLMTNMKLLDRQARRDGMSTEAQVKAALELATSMDVMAKLTGKSVKEQQDQLVESQRDGATQAKLRLLEKQGIEGVQEGFNASMTGLSAGGADLQKFFQDMTQTGVPMTAATKAFAARNGEAAAIAKRMAAVNASSLSKEEKQARLKDLSAQAVAATLKSQDSVQNLTVSSLGQVSDYAKAAADGLEQVGPIINQMEDYARQNGVVLGETLSYQEAYNKVFKQIAAETEKQKDGNTKGQDAQKAINVATLALAESASKVNLALGDQIATNTTVSNLLADAASGFAALLNTSSNIAVGTIDLAAKGQRSLEGADMEGGPTQNELRDVQNASPEDKAAFMAQFPNFKFNTDGSLDVGIVRVDPQINSKTVRADASKVTADDPVDYDRGNMWTEWIFPGIVNTVSDMMSSGTPTANALGGNVKAGEFLKVGEQGPETMIAGFDGAVIPNMKQMMNRLPQAIESMNLPPSAAEQSVLANMGMKDNDIAALVQQAQTTNELLSRLLGVNTAQGRIGEKHLKLSRGAGNLMTGLGRA